jgi:hypothetical protein
MATQNYDTFVNNQSFEASQATPQGLINTPLPTAAGVVSNPAPSAATATPYTGAQATAAKWDVQPNQTVQSQVQDIIKANSPLMQQAETRALQKMNARGLMNSSIAVGAGQSALYDAAMPIAAQDASTYARAGEFNAGAQQQVGLANQGSTNAASQFNAASENDMSKFRESLDADLAKFNASESNALKKLGLDAQTKTELANIEANYKMLMQSSASASDLYKQMVLNASNIMSSKDMDAAAKTAAMNNQMALLNSGLGMIGRIGNLNLEGLLTFDGASGGGSGAAAAPAAAPGTPAPASNGQPLPVAGSAGGATSGSTLTSWDVPGTTGTTARQEYEAYLQNPVWGNISPQEWLRIKTNSGINPWAGIINADGSDGGDAPGPGSPGDGSDGGGISAGQSA